MTPLQITFVACVVAFTMAAAAIDMRTRRLPNWLTVPGFLAGLLYHTVTSGFSGLGYSLLGFLAGFALLFVLWIIGGGGAGDVKLMGALGAWMGPQLILVVFLLSAFIAAVGSVAFVGIAAATQGFRHVQRRYLDRNRKVSAKQKRKGKEDPFSRGQKRRLMPYGLPVALSTWLVLVWQNVLHGAA
jgi:prepilin peptidase CpaA